MATLTPGEPARMYALAGVARAGATRAGYVSGAIFVKIGGVHVGYGRADPAVGVVIRSPAVSDVLDETPNTCRMRVNGAVVGTRDEVIVTLGSKNSYTRQFAGFALTVTQRYAGVPRNVQCDLAAVDYTWQLGFVKVTAQYRNESATAIVRDLVERFAGANGFTAHAVASGLPTLDVITFTNEDLTEAITRTMRRVGGYWYCDYYRDVHAFFTETRNGDPIQLTSAHRSLTDLTCERASTQPLTRVYVEGRGSRLLSNIAIGETVLPLESVDMFAAASDVFLKLSFQGSEGGAQHANFTGVVPSGGGSLVGPGVGPPGAPTVAPVIGTGLSVGTYQYAYTDVTASGQTLPSPIATIAIGGVVAPPIDAPGEQLLASPTGIDLGWHAWAYTYTTAGGGETLLSPSGPYLVNHAPMNPTGGISVVDRLGGGVLPPGVWFHYRVTYLADGGGETMAAAAGDTFVADSYGVNLPHIWCGSVGSYQRGKFPAGVAGVRVFRSPGSTNPNQYANGPFYYIGTATMGNAGTDLAYAEFYDYTPANAAPGAPIPTSNTAMVRHQHTRVTTPAAPTAGVSGVNGVKIYRSKVNTATPFFLVAAVSGAGGAVVYDDAKADSALGAAPPTTNTAGDEYRAVQIDAIAPGPSGTTGRSIYRTAANGAQLKLLWTIADNTTITLLDQVPDANLQGNAPTSDTSGFTQVAGQVSAGAAVIPVANAGVFPVGGGWAIIGNGEQVVRYSAHSATSLTGIPPTGIGAITAAIAFNSTITAAPMLTGIPASGDRSIERILISGDEAYLVVQCDDAAAQAALAADVGGTGIRAEWIQDRRLSIPEARARGRATLALRPIEIVSLNYRCRDLRTAAGKIVTVNLPAPTNISGQYRIQSVTIDNYRPRPNQYPTYTVTASSALFSFDDLLRIVKTKE